jgi:DNA-binding HxlR family transcriptional regulator
MRNERRSYADPCGVSRALDAIGERWALLIVRELILGPRRFGQLRDGLPAISPNVLTQRLQELEHDGLVHRFTPQPSNVPLYELTERGAALEPVLLELGRWGSAQPTATRRDLSVASMLMALKTLYDPAGMPTPTIYGVRIGDEEYRLLLRGDRIDITRDPAVGAVATIGTDVATLQRLVFRGTAVRAAESAGWLAVGGDRRAAARFPKYFRRPPAG